MNKNPYIKSCISYTGGKYKLLPQILPLFPQKKFKIFVEPFVGGCNLAQNVSANQYICCDTIKPLIELFQYLRDNDLKIFITNVDKVIEYFQLTKENQDGYLELRNLYNQHYLDNNLKNLLNIEEQVLFFTLICYCFNNQIRFNKKGEFNMPFGKNRSSFNPVLRSNLISWTEKIQTMNILFSCKDYKQTLASCVNNLDSESFIYLDPPYKNSTATYNENNGWTETDEDILKKYLILLQNKNIAFALSNDASVNPEIIEWAENHNLTIHHLNHSYANCSYHKKDKKSRNDEVLITNY